MRKKKGAKWEREKAEIKVGDIFCSPLLDRVRRKGYFDKGLRC